VTPQFGCHIVVAADEKQELHVAVVAVVGPVVGDQAGERVADDGVLQTGYTRHPAEHLFAAKPLAAAAARPPGVSVL
jgi:hypothetical protein